MYFRCDFYTRNLDPIFGHLRGWLWKFSGLKNKFSGLLKVFSELFRRWMGITLGLPKATFGHIFSSKSTQSYLSSSGRSSLMKFDGSPMKKQPGPWASNNYSSRWSGLHSFLLINKFGSNPLDFEKFQL